MIPKICIVFGTRPEAIKMAPVVRAFQADPGCEVNILVTAQHRQMLDQVLELFRIEPDTDLDVMQAGQDLSTLTGRLLTALTDQFRTIKPTRVLVQGDTTTAMTAALAAYYEKIPVGHIEAGLRTRNIYSPWPEEVNRQIVGTIADQHFAPTDWARQNLLAEAVPSERILVTGNTVIDALLEVSQRLDDESELRARAQRALPVQRPGRKLLLVTGHRRESFGEGFVRICNALRRLAERPDIELLYPVHLNPNVQAPVKQILGGLDNVHLIEPLDYLPFVLAMKTAHVILTDSGGVQEEAPSLGKPVLVMRDTTERPEAVEAGTVRLVATDEDRIVDSVNLLFDDEAEYRRMSFSHNPYGDGQAAGRIRERIRSIHEF